MTPGTRLLKIAPLLFNERFIATVVRRNAVSITEEPNVAQGFAVVDNVVASPTRDDITSVEIFEAIVLPAGNGDFLWRLAD